MIKIKNYAQDKFSARATNKERKKRKCKYYLLPKYLYPMKVYDSFPTYSIVLHLFLLFPTLFWE